MNRFNKGCYLALYNGTKLFGKILDYIVDENEMNYGYGTKWGAIYGTIFGICSAPSIHNAFPNEGRMVDIVMHSAVNGALMGGITKRSGLIKGAIYTFILADLTYELFEWFTNTGRFNGSDIIPDFIGIISYPVGTKIFPYLPALKEKVHKKIEHYEKILNR